MKKVKIGQIILFLALLILALCGLLPMLLVVIVAFSSESSLINNGFSFFPEEWSLDGWQYVLNMKDQILTSYGVTIFVTVVNTALGLLFMSLLAYALSNKNYILRRVISLMLLFTMMFHGGQLSSYLITTSVYHLKDTLLVLLIPGISCMNVVIIRTYIQSNITDSVIESAKMDGAGDFTIYFRIVMPLLLPVLASVGFMMATGCWNEWQKAYMYITSKSKMPLQLLLMRVEKNIEMLTKASGSAEVAAALNGVIPEDSARMALLVTAVGPIMIAYPFFQKYFVKGLTIGSVKG